MIVFSKKTLLRGASFCVIGSLATHLQANRWQQVIALAETCLPRFCQTLITPPPALAPSTGPTAQTSKPSEPFVMVPPKQQVPSFKRTVSHLNPLKTLMRSKKPKPTLQEALTGFEFVGITPDELESRQSSSPSPVSKKTTASQARESKKDADDFVHVGQHSPSNNYVSASEKVAAAQFSEFAYDPLSPEVLKKAANAGFRVVQDFQCKSSLGEIQQGGLVAYNQDENKIYVAFRGTTSRGDVLTDLYAIGAALPGAPQGTTVHSGMLRHFEDDIRDYEGDNNLLAVLSQVLKQAPTNAQIIFCGHSMGATMATLAAENFRLGLLTPLVAPNQLKKTHYNVKIVQIAPSAAFNTKASAFLEQTYGLKIANVSRSGDPVGTPIGSFAGPMDVLKPINNFWLNPLRAWLSNHSSTNYLDNLRKIVRNHTQIMRQFDYSTLKKASHNGLSENLQSLFGSP